MNADEDLEFRAMSYAADDEPMPAPYVGYPGLEREQDSLLHQLLASAHTVYCTINLVDHLYRRSPLLPRRHKVGE